MKGKYNLASPNGIAAPCDPANTKNWLEFELAQLSPGPVCETVRVVVSNLEEFVHWPKQAILLWTGCDRITPPGKKQRIHRFPLELKAACAPFDDWDTRGNGPAIAAFIVAGGERPQRFGSRNAWSVHHVYSGKFPHGMEMATTHAARHGLHFTQSAGLVATHPIADAICDEFPFFTWLLRAEAFTRFGYDPDLVFGTGHDQYGFVSGRHCRIIHEPVTTSELAALIDAAAIPGENC